MPRLILILLFCICQLTCFSATLTWIGTTNSDWTNSSNWSPMQIPISSDNIIIQSGANQPALVSFVTVAEFIMNSGSLDLGGFIMNIEGNAIFTSGTIENGSLTITGTTCTYAGTLFNVDISNTSETINFNGSTFNGALNVFNKTGSGTDYSEGGNTFNNSTTITLSGSGNLILGILNPDIFNNDIVIVNNSPFPSSSQIRIAESSIGNQINGIATIDNGNATPFDVRSIHICSEISATLVINNVIYLNNNGFNGTGIFFGENGGQTTFSANADLASDDFFGGTLLLSNVIADNYMLIDFLDDGASLRLGPGSIFNNVIFATTPRLFLDGANYNDYSSLTKTGASDDNSAGGNTFSASYDISNEGTGNLILGTTNPDIFNGPGEFSNRTASSEIRIAEGSSGNQLNFAITLDNGSAYPSGTRSISICKSNTSEATIMAFLTLKNNGSTGIFFGEDGGQTTFTNMSSFSFNGFVDGTVLFANSTFQSSVLINGISGNASLELGPQTVFQSTVQAISPRLFLNGATYNGGAWLTKNGTENDNSIGGNEFNSSVEILHEGSGDLILGTLNPDVFNGNSSFLNSSFSSAIYIAYNSSGNEFNGSAYLNNDWSGMGNTRSIRLCSEAASSLTIAGNVHVTNIGSTGVFFGENGGYTNMTPSSSLTSNEFMNGTLLLKNMQVDSDMTINWMSGTASLILGPTTVFNELIDAASPRLFLNGITCNDMADLSKLGLSDDISEGGNVYNGTTTLGNSGSGNMNLANLLSDTYNENLLISGAFSGNLDLSYAQEVFVKKDLYFNSLTPFTSGTNNGKVTFTSNNAQSILNFNSVIPVFNRIKIDKTANDLTLSNSSPIKIGIEADFTAGLINTSPGSYVEFLDNSSTVNESNTSFVHGSVRKTGDDFFVYPIGKGSQYRPCAINPPALITDVFTAEYFPSNSNDTYPHSSKVPSLNNISTCDYWTIDRTNGTSDINVYLSWSSPGCNGITDLNDLVVSRWDSALSQWQDHGNGGTIGDINDGYIMTLSTVTSFSPFALASVTPLNPLPVELLTFDAEFIDPRTVEVKWTTASEHNSDYFNVEKSTDGIIFDSFDSVTAAGNSQSNQEYSVLDNEPLNGVSYYRLLQFDLDGSNSYSQIVAVNLTTNDYGFLLYPNPVLRNGIIHLTGNETPDQVKILDLTGKIVKDVAFSENIQVDLPAGIYQIILLKETVQIAVQRLVVE